MVTSFGFCICHTDRSLVDGLGFFLSSPQFSTRVDNFSPEYVAQLFELQDQVFPFLLGDILDQFDYEPIAAASFGQGHCARLKGQEVVIKVQGPSLKDLFNIDLRI